ncbi:outer membrane beta-barrel protein [Chitinophagaceae bacterium 26-R-25]|nr:outer membrane beta-barrel protein [Chitinophagaceae bacterium 26-R-25]
MKKMLLAVVILASAAFSAKAQQGSVLVYGNVGLNTSKTPTNAGDGSTYKSTNFSIAPGVGYQFNKNWTVGGEVDFSTQKSGDAKAYNTFKVGPFVRYACPISDIFSIYGQLGTGYQGQKQSDYKASGVYAYIVPAVAVNVKNGFALNVAIGGIEFNNMKPKGEKASNSFGLTFGQAVSIGVSKNFGGKK